MRDVKGGDVIVVGGVMATVLSWARYSYTSRSLAFSRTLVYMASHFILAVVSLSCIGRLRRFFLFAAHDGPSYEVCSRIFEVLI